MTAPSRTKRPMPEWLVVLALIALLVAVAWGQFGRLFQQPTDGRGAPPAGGGEPSTIVLDDDDVTRETPSP